VVICGIIREEEVGDIRYVGSSGRDRQFVKKVTKE